MKTICKAIILSVLVVALTACNALSAKPTETPVPTATSLPTLTSTPEPTTTPTLKPTETPEPTFTPTTRPSATRIPPTETASAPGLPMPSGTPVAIWEGFPIMPNAIAGDGDSSSYSFTIMASADEVQDFYESQLPGLGWNLFATGQGETDTLLLMFMKGTNILTVSIIPQPDGVMYVMLVK